MNLSVAQRWQVAAIILVGLNLRPVLASVPPLLDALQAATGMTDGAAGLMTALPVFVMGIGALSAAPLRRLLGERLGVLLGLAVIAIAAGARLAADHTGALLATGVAAGLGIAIAQALLPGYIKARLAAASSGVMGLYSTAIMGAAIASVATPLMARQQSLSLSLAAWALPALVALACWARAAGRAEAVAHAAGADGAHGRRAWLLAISSAGTGAYTPVLAWLPPYYTRAGLDAGRGRQPAGRRHGRGNRGRPAGVRADRPPARPPPGAVSGDRFAAGRPGGPGHRAAGLCLAGLRAGGPGHRRPLSVVADRDHGPRGHARRQAGWRPSCRAWGI